MKLRFLGTVYRPLGTTKAEGFCPALLLDDTILIDPTEDIFRFAELYGMHELYDEVDTVLISHAHPSHMSPDALARLCRRRPITLYASEAVIFMTAHIQGMRSVPLFPDMPVCIGRYTVTPVSAAHTSEAVCDRALNFRIEKDGRAFFYGLDGGLPPRQVRTYLAAHPVDAMLLDGAYGEREDINDNEHMSLSAAASFVQEARENGALCGKGYAVLTHIPPLHAEEKYVFAEKAKRAGCTLPYDGFFMEI